MNTSSLRRFASFDSHSSPPASLHSSNYSANGTPHPKSPEFVPPPARRGYRPATASQPFAVATLPEGVCLQSASIIRPRQHNLHNLPLHASFSSTSLAQSYCTSARTPPTRVSPPFPDALCGRPFADLPPRPATSNGLNDRCTTPQQFSPSYHTPSPYIPSGPLYYPTLPSKPMKKTSKVAKFFGLSKTPKSRPQTAMTISNPTPTSLPISLGSLDLIGIQQKFPSPPSSLPSPPAPTSVRRPATAATLGRASAPALRDLPREHVQVTQPVQGSVSKSISAAMGKVSSRSPRAEWPKSWDEYSNRYAEFEIDIEDPPLPPLSQANFGHSHPLVPTPFETRVFMAPTPAHEEQRQATVVKLDLFGRVHSSSPITNYSKPSASQTREAVKSMENHPGFRAIVEQARELFGAQMGLLTILDDEKQLFLASGGMPKGIEVLPRNATFCSHTILNENRGLIVLDSHRDWRFTNSFPSNALGARFYAGVPLLAPDFGVPNAPQIPIGTLCVIDNRPRTAVSEEMRAKLQELAHQASKVIEAWVNERMSKKLEQLEQTFKAQSIRSHKEHERQRLLNAPVPPPRSLPAPQRAVPSPPAQSSTMSRTVSESSSLASSRPSEQWSRHSPQSSISSVSSVLSTTPSTKITLPTITDESVSPSVPQDVQRTFDTATRMLARALSLSLVYLVSLDLSAEEPTLRLLSSHGLSSPPPSFDPALHIKALRAPEGGLLYQNSRSAEERLAGGHEGYAAGLLIPVMEVRRRTGSVGYVLSGYAESDRAFGEKDMVYFCRFAEQLEPYCGRL